MQLPIGKRPILINVKKVRGSSVQYLEEVVMTSFDLLMLLVITWPVIRKLNGTGRTIIPTVDYAAVSLSRQMSL